MLQIEDRFTDPRRPPFCLNMDIRNYVFAFLFFLPNVLVVCLLYERVVIVIDTHYNCDTTVPGIRISDSVRWATPN